MTNQLEGRRRWPWSRSRARTDASARAWAPDFLSALSDGERAIVDAVAPFTMTTPERIVAAIDAVDYVIDRGIAGAFVECGVWRGGSVLCMILALQRRGIGDRPIYLYDTFEGMTAPTEHDTSAFSEPAIDTWERAGGESRNAWSYYFGAGVFGLDQVRALLAETGYAEANLHYVAGPVEETIPDGAPERIALLRLDTDWYESTRHELVHLYPRLATGGVLLIDDYGHWEGCRRAVDEYLSALDDRPFLGRVDYAGRIGVKP